MIRMKFKMVKQSDGATQMKKSIEAACILVAIGSSSTQHTSLIHTHWVALPVFACHLCTFEKNTVFNN